MLLSLGGFVQGCSFQGELHAHSIHQSVNLRAIESPNISIDVGVQCSDFLDSTLYNQMVHDPKIPKGFDWSTTSLPESDLVPLANRCLLETSVEQSVNPFDQIESVLNSADICSVCHRPSIERLIQTVRITS